MKNTILVLSLLSTACGSLDQVAAQKDKEDNKSEVKSDYTQLQGYVSPNNVTVDQKSYDDSETFYSEKLDQLNQELTKSGYEGWKLKFDADIGLEDLSNGMKVFIAATGNKGYANESYVSANGQFSFTIPNSVNQYQYNIRAVKRIGITITPPEYNTDTVLKSISWCYNFSAELNNFELDSEMVIMNSFTSKLTKYKCSTEDDANKGIHLP